MCQARRISSDTMNNIQVPLDHYLDNETSYNSYYMDYHRNLYILQTNQSFSSLELCDYLLSFLTLGILHKYTIFLFLSIAQFTIHSSFTPYPIPSSSNVVIVDVRISSGICFITSSDIPIVRNKDIMRKG